MNLPNRLTLFRAILAPVFMFALLAEFRFHYLVSLVIFIVASITDLLDGKIAREQGKVTDFGKFLDPLADKMLTTAAFLGFIPLKIGAGAVIMAFIVIFREFAVSSIRLVAVSSGGKVIAASIWGKLKTVFQMIAIIFALTAKEAIEVLTLIGVKAETVGVIGGWTDIATTILLWVSTFLCVISGVIYFKEYKSFVKETK